MSKGWSSFHGLQVELVVAAGTTRLRVEDAVAQLREGAVIALDDAAEAPLTILLGNRAIAHGECAIDGERVEVRVSDIAGSASDGAKVDSDRGGDDRLTERWAGSST